MKIFLELVVGVVVAFLIYNCLHYFFVTLPTRRYQLKMKHEVDAEIYKVVKYFEVEDQREIIQSYVGSQVLSDFWGRGVMVFEYRCVVKDGYEDADLLRSLLNQKLAEYAVPDGFVDAHEKKTLIVTDCWLNKRVLIFHVANVVNPATHEYLSDIDKLNEKERET